MVILTNQIVSNTSCDSQQCSIFAKIAKDGDIFWKPLSAATKIKSLFHVKTGQN